MIIAEISTFAIDGTGTSLSRYVKAALRVLEESGLKYHTGPMGTCIEAENVDDMFTILKKMHNAVADAGGPRIVTTIKIDDRRDRDRRMEDKLKAVEL